jgi:hypothetical protein
VFSEKWDYLTVWMLFLWFVLEWGTYNFKCNKWQDWNQNTLDHLGIWINMDQIYPLSSIIGLDMPFCLNELYRLISHFIIDSCRQCTESAGGNAQAALYPPRRSKSTQNGSVLKFCNVCPLFCSDFFF